MTASSLSYRPHLDGLRAIAVLMVFVFHAARPALSGGFIGVDIFFVLSGYLITRILLREHTSTGRISVARFYARRARRLLPAVLIVVIAVTLREAVWGNITERAARLTDAVATLFYAQNWNLIFRADEYFAESLDASPLRHAWSLSIEEQFYVLWPILLVGLLWAARKKTSVSLAMVTVLVAVSAGAMAILFDPALVQRAYYGTGTRVHQPLIGAALAFLVEGDWIRAAESKRRAWALVGLTSMLSLIVAASAITGESASYYLGGSTLVALAAAALIVALEHAPDAWLTKVLSAKPFVHLGRISYGFYLWHWPIILWLTMPASATFWERRMVNLAQFTLTVAIATASFVLIEDPVRSGRIAFASLKPRTTIAGGMAGVVIVAAFSFMLLGASSSDPATASGSPEPKSGNPPASTPELSLTNEELAQLALSDRSYEPCPDDPTPCVKVDGIATDAPTMVLVGDSTAQAYDPALKELARTYGFRYVQAAVGGCPIGHRLLATGTDGNLHKPSNFTCFEQLPSIYDTVLGQYQPDLVIATSWNDTNQHVEDGALLEKGH